MKHILIVEDDTILNETLSFNLQQKGYITQSAQNQKEALIKLKSVMVSLYAVTYVKLSI